MVLVRPAAKKALFIQAKERQRKINIAALEKFEATFFPTQEEVLRTIGKLGFNAALAGFPFEDQRAIEKLLKPFEFEVAAEKTRGRR